MLIVLRLLSGAKYSHRKM